MSAYAATAERKILAWAEIQAAEIRMCGMVAANTQRANCGHSVAWDDAAFEELADGMLAKVRDLLLDPREDAPDGTLAATETGR